MILQSGDFFHVSIYSYSCTGRILALLKYKQKGY